MSTQDLSELNLKELESLEYLSIPQTFYYSDQLIRNLNRLPNLKEVRCDNFDLLRKPSFPYLNPELLPKLTNRTIKRFTFNSNTCVSTKETMELRLPLWTTFEALESIVDRT